MTNDGDPRWGEADTGSNVSSIRKAARVLRALALSGDTEAGVTQLASLAALPKSTTHRVLAELVREGLASHSEQHYRLGQGWFELQSALCSSEWVRLVDQARKPLGALFERSGATVHFGVLHEERVLYLEKLTGRGGTRIPTRVGARMPPTCTALGKALLAHADAGLARSILSKPLPVVSQRSVTLPGVLLQQLSRIRHDGIAYDLEESQAGLFCVAAPVFVGGRAIAAVSVSRAGGSALASTDAAEVHRTARQIADWLTVVPERASRSVPVGRRMTQPAASGSAPGRQGLPGRDRS